jgi:molecular chaperone GrpE
VSTKGDGHDDDLPVAAATEPAAPEGETPESDGDVSSADSTGLAESPPLDEMEALRAERDALRDTLLRRRADFENYRRRVERDRGTVATDVEAALLRQLLSTVDNLERALAASGGESGLRSGVELTHRELLTLLGSLGVAALAPLGEPFDPALHQAILHEPVAGVVAGTVAEVYRKGYTYKDRLLRPALVKVAAGGPAKDGDDVQ